MRKTVVSVVGSWVAVSACSADTLDLGHNEMPRYATPETIAAEESAPPGTPTVMATLQYGASAIAVDGTRVYWSTSLAPSDRPDLAPEGCAVRSCVKTDCAATLITYTSGCNGVTSPSGRLFVNQTYVFWSAGDVYESTVYGCPIEGCAGAPTLIVRTGVQGFAVDDTHIYWKSRDATLLRCPIGDCASPVLLTLLDSMPDTVSRYPVVDATDVYWVSDARTATGTILTTLKQGMSPVRTFASGLLSPNNVTIVARNIYWTENPREIKSCPLTGCIGAPVVLASQQAAPTSLAVNGDHAFWFTSHYAHRDDVDQRDLDTIWQCKVAGCGSEADALLEEPVGIGAIAVDATHVYWTSTHYPARPEPPVPPSMVSHEPLDGFVKRIRRRP